MGEALLGNLLAAVNEATGEPSTPFQDDPNFLKQNLVKEASNSVHTGLTDSSDDEDNRDFETQKYNEFGRSVKHLMQDARGSVSSSPSSTESLKWSTKKLPDNAKNTDSLQLQVPTNKKTVEEHYIDPIFGISIKNPLISSITLKARMQGRLSIPLHKLRGFVDNIPANTDWVITGVIVHKTGRTSQKGNPFSIWTLSDLHGDLKTMTLFLFRSAYKDLWKCTIGTVVGILNPTVFEKKQGSRDEVCTKFNEVGGNLLNRGFLLIERRHATILKRVKSLLPRRESERRAHLLSKHCDILSAIDTRMSMLNMTYSKYIESNECCFIPGKVLDELGKVLRVVEVCSTPPRANELLQELRDISSMAMEHFDEKIAPNLKLVRPSLQYKTKPVASPTVQKVYYYPKPTFQKELNKVSRANKRQRTQISDLSEHVQSLVLKVETQQNIIKAQASQLLEHATKLKEQETKLQQQDAAITDINKHIAEWKQKFVDLSMEVIHSHDDLLKSIYPVPNEINQAPPVCNIRKTIIRPRVSQVQTPNTYIVELERKRKASIDADIPNKLRFIMKRESDAQFLKEKVANKINENITQNISKSIRDGEDTGKKKYNMYSSVGNLVKYSISAIRTRNNKRRLANETVNLINLH